MLSPDRTAPAELDTWSTTAMACRVTIQARPAGTARVQEAAERAIRVFRQVETACTRFDPTSPLMVANSAPARWHRVPRPCLAALQEAHAAHLATGGLFDPRVHDVLVRLGYDRSLPFDDGSVEIDAGSSGGPVNEPWRPRFRPVRHMAHLGGCRIDLGGIGKGLAVRWATARMRSAGHDFLVEAGGDCYACGSPGDGDGWRIGVESPTGASEPVAVLRLSDLAVATSSTRVRQWKVGDRPVHHLIDPRTGQPGGRGLASTTVVHPDPSWAEVWSKALFLSGPSRLAALADRHRLAALWIDEAGTLRSNRAMTPYLLWVAP